MPLEKERALATGGSERTERSQSESILARHEEIREDAELAVDDAADHSPGPRSGSLAGRMAPSLESSRSERPAEARAGRPRNAERRRGSAPTLEAEAAAALAESSGPCPLCGPLAAGLDRDRLGDPHLVACSDCTATLAPIAEILPDLAARSLALYVSRRAA